MSDELLVPGVPQPSTTAWIRNRFRDSVKAAAKAPPAEPLPPQFGRYRVLQHVGRGSIANVYRAAGEGDREVAIKAIRPDQAGPEAEAVFRREAEILRSLKHPDIVSLLDIGREGDVLYLVMDYILGPTLHYVVEQGAPREELVPFVARVARAVHHAHGQGIVHRDLKPQNILIGPDGPVIADFGIAHAMDELARKKGGPPIGTPTHMAPEQIDARLGPIGPAADIWGLGVLLYYVLCKRLPFYDIDAASIYERVLNDTPRPPSGFDSSVPAPLEAVCLNAIEKDAADRYRTAEEFAADIDRGLSGQAVSRRPFKALRRGLRRLFRR